MKINKTFHLKGENNLATFFYLKKKKKPMNFLLWAYVLNTRLSTCTKKNRFLTLQSCSQETGFHSRYTKMPIYE